MISYLLVLFILAGVPAWACSCGGWPSAKGAWEESPVVFLGRVEKTEQQLFDTGGGEKYIGEQRASVRVEEPFKGVRTDEILELEQPGHNCAPKFKEGKRVVFYLHPVKQQGTWEAYGCHRTRDVESAADDLQFLRALPWAATRSRLSGEVSVYENSVATGFRRVRNLEGIEIQIRGEGKLVETVTNGAGVYELYDLPAGTYEVSAKLPKGLKIRFPMVAGGVRKRGEATSTAVELKMGSGVGVDFLVSEDNELAGRVLDPEGRPMKGVHVELEPASGPAGSNFYASDHSKENGEFRIDNMPAGEYRLVANRRGQVSGGIPFSTVYFPGTEDKQKAEVLKIGAGEHRENLELRIPRFEKVIAVSGRVQFSDGQPAAGASLFLIVEGKKDSLYLRSDSEGLFRAPLLAGTPKRLRAELFVYKDEVIKACPQFREARGKGGSATFQSQEVEVKADRNEPEVLLTLPVKSCTTR